MSALFPDWFWSFQRSKGVPGPYPSFGQIGCVHFLESDVFISDVGRVVWGQKRLIWDTGNADNEPNNDMDLRLKMQLVWL